MIEYDSRYVNAQTIIEDNIEYYARLDPEDYPFREDDRYHEITEDDRIDILAREYLGHHKYWWVICDYNGIDFPLELPVGETIRIPSVENFEMNIID